VLTLDIEMPLASRIEGAALARMNLGLSRFAPAPAGIALVAPGDFHMKALWNGIGYQVLLNQSPLQHFVRPAVDVLLDSAASCAQPNAVAPLLTRMGTDGALGMQGLKTAGTRTIAHDESSSVVYGVPRAAIELSVADQILPLCEIPAALICAVSTRRSNGAQLTSSSHPAPAHPPSMITTPTTPHQDMQLHLQQHLQEVFATMLSLETIPTTLSHPHHYPERVTVSVGLGGEQITGALYLHMSADFARHAASSLLRVPLGELTQDAEVNDVIGELTNMVAGGLRSHLCDKGLACAISTPAIIRGTAYEIEPLHGVQRKQLLFLCGTEHLALDVHLKTH